MTREINIPYAPNPKQAEFHGLSSKYRGFCGGWGNGKTTAGCVEFFARLMEYPGCNSIISRKTRPELRATTWDMWLNGDDSEGGWHGVPKEAIRVYNKSDLYMELHNGSRIHGLPLDDPKKLENYNLGLFWIDQAEEIEEDTALKFRGRLRQQKAPREGLFTFNPDGHNYLWRWFIDPKRNGRMHGLHKVVEATPWDNPNLPEDYLEQFSSLPEHWYQRYVEGSHEVFVGQIFTDWNPEIHVIEPFRIPSKWERWCAIDPGIRHEGCLSWVAQDFQGNVFYYREVLKAGQDIPWWAATKTEMEAEDDIGGPDEDVDRILVGPEARIRAQTDGRSVLDLWHDAGIYPEIADRDPTARISRITEYLRPKSGHIHPFGAMATADHDGDAADGAPRLYVFSTCTKLTDYLPQYRWRPSRVNVSDEDAPEKVRKKDDHNIDCLGHILVAIDDLPEMEASDEVLDPEQRLADENFERELAAATERAPLSSLPHRRGSRLLEEEEAVA